MAGWAICVANGILLVTKLCRPGCGALIVFLSFPRAYAAGLTYAAPSRGGCRAEPSIYKAFSARLKVMACYMSLEWKDQTQPPVAGFEVFIDRKQAVTAATPDILVASYFSCLCLPWSSPPQDAQSTMMIGSTAALTIMAAVMMFIARSAFIVELVWTICMSLVQGHGHRPLLDKSPPGTGSAQNFPFWNGLSPVNWTSNS